MDKKPSSPKSPENQGVEVSATDKQPVHSPASRSPVSSGMEASKTQTDRDSRKKKKGIFGGLFGKQGKQKRSGRKPGKSPGRRLKLEGSGDGSI